MNVGRMIQIGIGYLLSLTVSCLHADPLSNWCQAAKSGLFGPVVVRPKTE
jgi:hypothetical protein